MDLVNIYQVPTGQTITRPEPMKHRLDIWNSVHQLLHQLPVRNTLVLGGDFNTSLRDGNGVAASDTHMLRSLIKDYGLTNLRTNDNTPTYVGPRGSSTIDYLFMRQAQCDKRARHTKCLVDFPLIQDRAFPDHRPLIGSIPADWKVWIHCKTQSTHVLPHNRTKALIRAAHQHQDGWRRYLQEAAALTAQFPAQDPEHLTSRLLQLSTMATTKVDPSMPLWLQPQCQSLVARKWRNLFRARHCGRDLHGLFLRWAHWTKFMQYHKQLQLHCRQSKRDRIRTITASAARAAHQHDSRALYEAVRALTPKQLRKAIRFRGPQGQILAPDQELDWLCDHFHDLFGHEDQPCPLTCAPWLVSADEIAVQLSKTKIHKAVAPGTLPGNIIKSMAEPLARCLEAYLWSQWQSAPCVPACWKDAHLTLLAKNKVLTPADLRPIALTCGLGKALLGTYMQKARDFMLPTMQKYPVFAYLPHRGVPEALYLAHQFCPEIRERCQAMRPGPWTPSAQTQTLPGGLILSMDLKQAYDRLPRQQLAEGLAFCGCPPSLQTVLLHWLHEAHYHLKHRGLSRSITTSRGVRQGCRASPLEWTAFLILVCHRIGMTINDHCPQEAFGWICNHLITYADDILSKWCVHSAQELHQVLRQIGTTFDLLEKHGLVISFAKTTILLRVEGRGMKTCIKNVTKTQDGCAWILIPRTQGHTMIKLVSQRTYLGVQLSFRNFEQMTLRHRLQDGQITRHRLRPWLNGKHVLTSRDRAQLWSTCVLSSYAHGLGCCGLRQEGLQLLCNKIHSDLRRIGKSPQHVTHEHLGEQISKHCSGQWQAMSLWKLFHKKGTQMHGVSTACSATSGCRTTATAG